jgi:hypothetical protein
MNRRNSKSQMLTKIDQLNKQLEEVYDAGHWGIEHVGSANYAEREREALNKLHIAMYGEGIYD